MNKACPVVIRESDSGHEILAFHHPLAGNQIVKGSIEGKESLERACERELKEESGVTAKARKNLGTWHSNHQNQIWGFCLMSVNRQLDDTWQFYTEDDGGHCFEFFWQPLNEELDENWHPLFVDAINFIREKL